MCVQGLGCLGDCFVTGAEVLWIFLWWTVTFCHEHCTSQEMCKIKYGSRTQYFIGKMTFCNNGIINTEGGKAKCKCWNAFMSTFVLLLQLLECHLLMWIHSVKHLKSITVLGKWASSIPLSSELIHFIATLLPAITVYQLILWKD